jgi:serine-aspartate repeat-containing protein C/D/E
MSLIDASGSRLRWLLRPSMFIGALAWVLGVSACWESARAQSTSHYATQLASNDSSSHVRPVPDFVAPAQRSMATKFFCSAGNPPAYSWHLSVINAGYPRGEHPGEVPQTKRTVSRPDGFAIPRHKLKQVQWTLLQSLDAPEVREHVAFGMAGGIPVTGDFNGDGETELGVFFRGQWFIDLNGNGAWDSGDLWANLGDEGDQPVTGDWDGDGKTDIGIFGRTWTGDHDAANCDPGLPDAQNRTRFELGRGKNQPQTQTAREARVRTMKLTSVGELHSDPINHVFFYGSEGHKPVAGDFNGDGISSIGVFRQGRFLLDTNGDGRWSAEDLLTEVGTAGALPVIGDFNGDGIDDIGIYRRGTWQLDTNGDQVLDARDLMIQLGGPDDLPIVGDWNGDGKDEIGIYHTSIAEPEEL